uniref:Toll/interleukin-1 receptor-like protein n=1 Tax=Rhizophora mucronata TaxID=61149 RepID=A0A2P2LWJ1_RHIMU
METAPKAFTRVLSPEVKECPILSWMNLHRRKSRRTIRRRRRKIS